MSAISQRARRRLCIAAIAASISTLTAAQRFRSSVDVVRVDVLVTDGGKPVRGLTSADFEIRDNDVLQQLDLIGQEDVPINAVLALDSSESISGERLTHLRDGGRAFIGALKPGDQAGLIGFSHVVVLGSALTHDFAQVRDVLDRTTTTGDTSLADACFASLVLAESEPGRGIVLVFSDGADTTSWLTSEVVLNTAKRSDVVVYGVSTSPSAVRTAQGMRLPAPPQNKFLHDMADASGGSVIDVDSTKNLSQVFVRVLEEFRLRYLVSFTPRGVTKDGYHRLSVKVKGHSYKIKARPGYLAR